MFQQVIVIGHVGKDPEMHTMPSGAVVANFSVAASERWKDKESGEQKEATEWFRCAAFGRLGEVIGEYVSKGSKIMVTGRMKTRKYEKDGQDHYATTLNVFEMKLLDSKGDSGERQERPAQESRPSSTKTGDQRRQPAQSSEDFDDDIPF